MTVAVACTQASGSMTGLWRDQDWIMGGDITQRCNIIESGFYEAMAEEIVCGS